MLFVIMLFMGTRPPPSGPVPRTSEDNVVRRAIRSSGAAVETWRKKSREIERKAEKDVEKKVERKAERKAERDVEKKVERDREKSQTPKEVREGKAGSKYCVTIPAIVPVLVMSYNRHWRSSSANALPSAQSNTNCNHWSDTAHSFGSSVPTIDLLRPPRPPANANGHQVDWQLAA